MRVFIAFLCFIGQVALLLTASPLHAQNRDESAFFRETWTTWEDFVEEFLQSQQEEDETEGGYARAMHHASLQRLEDLLEQPLNLNTARRDDLLELPWLSEEQVDSLLAYRARIRVFSSLGDLMAVPRWGYQDRKWASLFVYVGDTIAPQPSWTALLREGRHTLHQTTNVPLYLREGFRPYDKEGRARNRDALYLGPPLAHSLRYRYEWHGRLKWGASFQNDSGEPFAQHGHPPFDHQSAYLWWRSASGQSEVLVGDYDVQLGQGLLIGQAFLLAPLHQLLRPQLTWSRLRPHSSTEEGRFLRGGAFLKRWKEWHFSAFASHRWRDGRIEADTVRAFLESGLHRSWRELTRASNVGVVTLGGHAQHIGTHFRYGLNLYTEHYSLPVAPSARRYNRHYLRGQWAGGVSGDYGWRQGAWSVQGELACDLHGHASTTHHAQWAMNGNTRLLAQVRYFSPQFVAPRAHALSQSSRVQNELGLLLGLTHQWRSGLKMRAFIDLFRHEAPTFRADTSSQGLELRSEWEWGNQEGRSHLLRYHWRARQQNIPRHAPLLEYRHTQNLHYQWRASGRAWTWQWGAQLSLHHRQTWAAPTWGALLSSRGSWKVPKEWQVAAFVALFHTADYDTRLYAYQPQLRPMGGFPTFAHSGASAVLQVQWKWHKRWSCGLRTSLYHYFDRENIGSGMQRIAQPTQADIDTQVRWRF